jgi:hypothetical protein
MPERVSFFKCACRKYLKKRVVAKGCGYFSGYIVEAKLSG